jgi:hypothetical protein
VHLARYAEHVQRYREAFGPDRVLCILFDDLRREPERIYAESLAFLDLPQTPPPELSPLPPPRFRAICRVEERAIATNRSSAPRWNHGMSDDGKPDPQAVAEEQRRLDRLRRLVDVTCAVLRQTNGPRAEAEALVAAARQQALALFPDKADVFDLVLAPRFRRILEERWPAQRRVLPFRSGSATGSRR